MCGGIIMVNVCILVDFVASRIGNFCWILHLEFVLLPSWSYRWSSNDCLLVSYDRINFLVQNIWFYCEIWAIHSNFWLDHKAVWIQTAHVNQRLKSLVYSFFLIILQCPEQPRYHQDLISYIPNVGKIPPQRSSGKS